MLDAMGAHFGVDVAGMAKETAAKLEEQKPKAAEAASAAKPDAPPAGAGGAAASGVDVPAGGMDVD
eukprot:4040273-Pyramimonas_sp.AAC.1